MNVFIFNKCERGCRIVYTRMSVCVYVCVCVCVCVCVVVCLGLDK